VAREIEWRSRSIGRGCNPLKTVLSWAEVVAVDDLAVPCTDHNKTASDHHNRDHRELKNVYYRHRGRRWNAGG